MNTTDIAWKNRSRRRGWMKEFERGYRAEAENWSSSARATKPSVAYLAGMAAALESKRTTNKEVCHER